MMKMAVSWICWIGGLVLCGDWFSGERLFDEIPSDTYRLYYCCLKNSHLKTED